MAPRLSPFTRTSAVTNPRQYAIGTVLAPTAQHYVDSKYLNLVTDLENLRKFNWGCFTLNHFFKSVHKFRNRDHVNLQGNLILLQVSARSLLNVL